MVSFKLLNLIRQWYNLQNSFLYLKNESNLKSNLKENDYIITDEIYNTFEDGKRSIGKDSKSLKLFCN